MADTFKFPDEQDPEAKGEAAGGEVEIEILDDTPEKDRGRAPLNAEVAEPTDEELESYSSKVQSRIKELTHARHDERRVKEATLREKQELETFARALMEENKKLKGTVDEGTKHLTTAAMSAAEAALAKAKAELKEANDSFDSDAAVAAQEAMMDAKVRIENLKNFRPVPLQRKETEVQIPQSQQTVVQPDEKALRWQAKNQWFGAPEFEEVTSFALGLHQKLVRTGVSPQSDEYYKEVDSRIRNTFPEMFNQVPSSSGNGNGTKRPASVVAPATRSSGPRKVQLTQTQVALARKLNITPQQYAAQLIKLEKQNGA
jgi:hypothetical protein